MQNTLGRLSALTTNAVISAWERQQYVWVTGRALNTWRGARHWPIVGRRVSAGTTGQLHWPVVWPVSPSTRHLLVGPYCRNIHSSLAVIVYIQMSCFWVCCFAFVCLHLCVMLLYFFFFCHSVILCVDVLHIIFCIAVLETNTDAMDVTARLEIYRCFW